jgi:hypothetical protein
VSEFETVSFYANKGRVEYEPPRGDLKLWLNEHEIYFEVAKLFSSKEEKRIMDLTQVVRCKIDDIMENKYVLSFRISIDFLASDVDPFVKHVSNIIANKYTTFPTERFPYRGEIASVTVLAESVREKGYVGGSLFSIGNIDTAGRLKKKILDEANQLPDEGLNVVVYNIGLIGADFDDAEEAFLGQVVCKILINKRTGETQAQWVRLENGAIHEGSGKKISALVAYKDFRYESRRLFENPLANHQVPLEVKNQI